MSAQPQSERPQIDELSDPRESVLQWAVRQAKGTPVVVTALFLAAMMTYFSIAAHGKFMTSSNMVSIAQNVAILTIVSVGTTFVIATGGIDLSIPAGIILGEVFAAEALRRIHVDVPPGSKAMTAIDVSGAHAKASYLLIALGAALLAGLAIGLTNGVLCAYMRIPPLIATLATWFCGLGFALIIRHGVNIAGSTLDPMANGHLIPGVTNLVLIGAVVVILGIVGLNRSVFGRHTLAVGSNDEAARRVGINVERQLVKVYTLGGLCNGFAGFLSLAYFNTTSVGGHSTDNLQAITAVAIGGTSVFGGIATVVGTLIGVWIPAVLRNGLVIIGINAYWQYVVMGAVLVLAVWVDQLRRRKQSGR